MTDDTNEEPKIIVDDDWKSQVEKEKQELNQPKEEPGQQPGDAEAFPPATFLILLQTLASQAMAALGLMPDPVSGQPVVNRPMAKHLIDLLAMLQEKTKGNLSDEESAHLRDALHQLRMMYVSLKDAPAAPEPNKSDKPSSIELP